MIGSKISGLMVVDALQRSSSIETRMTTDEVAAAVLAGVVVIVKGVFDPDEMRRLRAAIMSASLPYSDPHFDSTTSWRTRREVREGEQVGTLFETAYLAVHNPHDEVGRAASATAERLANYWRALTGYKQTFAAEPDRRALRVWSIYYPAGGGCFDWHVHTLEPTKIGVVVSLSEIGADFGTSATEFETPSGVVNSMSQQDIGDVCLFRYDLKHRVAPVDPHQQRHWDGSGRWSLIIPVDPRPLEPRT